MDRNTLKTLIRAELLKALDSRGPGADAVSPAETSPARAGSRPLPGPGPRARKPGGASTGAALRRREVINRADVMAAREKGVLLAPANAIVTPLARETAEQYRIEIRPAVKDAGGPGDGCPKTGGVAIASDHGGYAMKELLKKHVADAGYRVDDLGPRSSESVDYPDYARAVAEAVASGRAARGIMIDGVGIGSTMAANKVAGIRAAMCSNQFEVNNSREHNNANVLCIGGRTLGEELAKAMVIQWLSTPFAGGRHQRRIDKIMAIESDYRGGDA